MWLSQPGSAVPKCILSGSHVLPSASQGIRLAAGELTLRVTEERRRRAVMLRDVGPLPEARMRGDIGTSLLLLPSGNSLLHGVFPLSPACTSATMHAT